MLQHTDSIHLKYYAVLQVPFISEFNFDKLQTSFLISLWWQ